MATLRRCRGCNYLIELRLHVALRQTGRLTWQTSPKDQKQRTVKRRGRRNTRAHTRVRTRRETQAHMRQLNSSGCKWRILLRSPTKTFLFFFLLVCRLEFCFVSCLLKIRSIPQALRSCCGVTDKNVQMCTT